MRSRPGRLIRRLASWPRVLAIVATGMHVIGWGRVGRAGLTLVRGVAGATWPALRLVWPGLVVLAIAGLLTHRGRALLARVRIGVRFPWLVGALALAVFGLVVLSLLVFPRYLVQRSLDATGTPTLSAAERLKAENDARTTLLQGVAGLVLVVGAGATWRQIQINRKGQITERFNKAINHLGEPGDDKIDVRLGGIYALERIANNSKDDRATIAEILTAYVRGHAAWTTTVEDANPSGASTAKPAELRVRAPDIQAVMSVLGRRALPPGEAQPLLLADTDLRRADLKGANLERADLGWAHLERAYLRAAHLEEASLGDAHLEEAYLGSAHLNGAYLRDAHLEGASLSDAHLEGANLVSAQLKRAYLARANLAGAILDHANLAGGEPPRRQPGGGDPRPRQPGGGEPPRGRPRGGERDAGHLLAGWFRLESRQYPNDLVYGWSRAQLRARSITPCNRQPASRTLSSPPATPR
jgi:hypothetical protein